GFIYLRQSGSSVLDLSQPAAGGAPTVTTDPNTGDKLVFKNYGLAPELNNVQWLNGEAQTTTNLRGKVILVNFWTYSCITCIRMIPQLNQWVETYRDQGLAVISVHTPEYAFEKVADSVQAAVQRYHISY